MSNLSARDKWSTRHLLQMPHNLVSRIKFIWSPASIENRSQTNELAFYNVFLWQGLPRPTLGFGLDPCYWSYISPSESFGWMPEKKQPGFLLDFLQVISVILFEDCERRELHAEGQQLLLHPQRRHGVHLGRDLQRADNFLAAGSKYWLIQPLCDIRDFDTWTKIRGTRDERKLKRKRISFQWSIKMWRRYEFRCVKMCYSRYSISWQYSISSFVVN